MLRLGSLLLTGVLLGVPRALDARAFGAQRPVYVEVSPLAPELQAFARDLERALLDASYRLAADPSQATLVLELRSAATTSRTGGSRTETVIVDVRDGSTLQPLLLHYVAERRLAAARALLQRLGPAPHEGRRDRN